MSARTDTSGTRNGQNPPANESTPLLHPIQPRNRQSQSRTSRGSAFSFLSRRSLDYEALNASAVDDEYDYDFDSPNGLLRHRSRLNSHPVLEPPEEIKKRDSVAEKAPERDINEGHEQGEGEGREREGKFMNVGPVRFWCVFITILLGAYHHHYLL